MTSNSPALAPASTEARLGAICGRGLLDVWTKNVAQAPSPLILDVLVDEPWTPDLLDRLLRYARHADAQGPDSWMHPGSSNEDSMLSRIALRLVAHVRRYRILHVTLPVERLVDWLMLAATAQSNSDWGHVDSMLVSGGDDPYRVGDSDYLNWMAAPVTLAPLLWAAGYSGGEAAQVVGDVDPEGLAVLAALNGWRLPARLEFTA